MQIYGTSHLHGPQGIGAPHANRATQAPQRPAAANQADSVEFSAEAQAASQLTAKIAELPEMRMDRVNELRAKIASGAYETDERMGGALERLLDEIG